MLKSANRSNTPSTTNSRGVWLTVAVICAFMALLVTLFVYRVNQPTLLNKRQLLTNGAFIFDQPKAINNFTLLNHHGKVFTKQNLKGKWTLLFFGFTQCSEICPTTLADLNNVYRQLEQTEAAGDVQVVMVSVDPGRDTPEKLAEYLAFFHSDFIGVTGEFMAIYRLSSNLNAVFNKVALADNQNSKDYDINHSANIVLVNPTGDYHGFFKPPFDLATLKMTYRSIRLQF